MSYKWADRVRIGSSRVVWRVMHDGPNEAGRYLVEAEVSRRMKTADPTQFKLVKS